MPHMHFELITERDAIGRPEDDVHTGLQVTLYLLRCDPTEFLIIRCTLFPPYICCTANNVLIVYGIGDVH